MDRSKTDHYAHPYKGCGMGWIDQVMNRWGWSKTNPYGMKTAQVPTAGWLRAEAEEARFNLPDGSIWENQADLYRRLSWVLIAVQLVAQSCAAVKLSVKKLVGEEEEDIPNHPFEERMRKPNPLQSRFELLESTFSYYALTGNAYWWLSRDNEKEEPQEIWSMPSYKVTPVPDGKMFIKGYRYDGLEPPNDILKPCQVVHFKRFNPLSIYVGLSPIEALATVAQGDLGMQSQNTKLFTKSNSRLPGILAFADPIGDPQWEQIQADVTNKAMKRQMMLLRNVGKGGVEWIQAAMTYKDMEFLAGRKSNKQEIFDAFAPGLYAMLSENATEANSRTAKGTFTEFCLWSILNMAGEKITNDVLLAYGEDLVAEFDDVRYTDRQMQLQESQEYARTHSIDEIRKEKYGDGPLGDERGEMLPAQIGSAPVGVGGEEIATTPAGSRNDNGNDGHEELSEFEKGELARRLFGGHAKPVENEREIGKGTLALTPSPSQNTLGTQSTQPSHVGKNIHGRGGEIEEELRAWESFEVKRLGKKKTREFECKMIDEVMEGEIREGLEKAESVEAVKAVFSKVNEKVGEKDFSGAEKVLDELRQAVRVMREAV